jgi:aryl sulfotransferase
MKVYQNFILDSTRWNHIAERDGDVIVSTPYKSGTTWMQNIVLHLIFLDFQSRNINTFSPWIENRIKPINELKEIVESQQHRRCFKTHLPADGLKIRGNSKYIIVGRDPRDVFVSLWNQYKNYTPEFYELVNNTPGRVGNELPVCPTHVSDFWDMWINRGWFPWENEGYPHWSNLRNVQTWWDISTHPNILLVHYNDLLVTPIDEIKKISQFLNIYIDMEAAKRISELVSFSYMKSNSDILLPNSSKTYKDGNHSFFNSGTSNQWKSVLSEKQLSEYEIVSNNELTKECKKWLEGSE